LISKNSRDSLAKARALTDIFSLRPSDLDRTVRSPIGGAGRQWIGRSDLGGGSDGPIPIWNRSNLDRPLTIGRPGPIGVGGGGAITPATPFRGGAAWGSPDFTVNGAPGVKPSGAWVCRDQRDTCDPPGALSGPRGLGVALAVLGCRNGLRSTMSSAKRTREGVGAHRGLGLAGEAVQGGRRRWREVEMRQRSWRGLLQGFSGLLGSTGLPVVFLRR
jgi:hypothetical protein